MTGCNRQMSRTIVLGIGNQLGGDDAAGIRLVGILNRRLHGAKAPYPAQVTAIDAGTAPESYTSVIRRHRPDLLLLVDAADMGLPPGALRIIRPEKISLLLLRRGGACWSSARTDRDGQTHLTGGTRQHKEVG